MITLTEREVRSFFLTPVGYIVIALFVVFASLVFNAGFEQGQPASMQKVFRWGMWILLVVCPAITMGLISEERRLGTFELLVTSPVREFEIIAGKFLGAMAFLILMLTPTLFHVALLEIYGRPDYGELACGYLGLLLAGSAYIATGLLASTLTTSQLLAYLATFLGWLAVLLAFVFAPTFLDDPWLTFAFASDPIPRLHDFAIGLIDMSNVIYFVSIAVFFLIVSNRVLEAQRWP